MTNRIDKPTKSSNGRTGTNLKPTSWQEQSFKGEHMAHRLGYAKGTSYERKLQLAFAGIRPMSGFETLAAFAFIERRRIAKTVNAGRKFHSRFYTADNYKS